MTTLIRPLGRLIERSEQNPTGVLFRDFTAVITRADDATDDGPIAIAISSEAPVLRYDWRSRTLYYEVLDHAPASVDLSYCRDGIPFCLDHWLEKQVGIGENVRVDADRLMRTEVREGSHPDAEWVFADMRDGVRPKVSVGYDPGDAYIETKNEGDEYATRRYTRWTPYEVSSVTVPADYNVGTGRDARGVAKPGEVVPAQLANTGRNNNGAVLTPEEIEAASRAAVAAAVAARNEQIAELTALATNHNRGAELPSWIAASRSVASVKDEILNDITARNAARPDVGAAAPITTHNREEDKPWESLSSFMRAVKQAANSIVDPRLTAQIRAATGMGIGTDSDGGFMVPEQFAEGVVTRAFNGGALLKRVKRIPISGNQYHMTLIDETSRANGSRWGGVRGYRMGEGAAATPSKPKTRRATLDVTKKIAVAVWASEEQLEDAPATDTILNDAMSQELTVVLEQEIWSGIGGAQCLGFTTSGAVVSVVKKVGQTAATVVAENVTAMNAALWAGSHGPAAWFINQTVLGQLPLMTIGNQPVWLPPTGLVGSSLFGTMLGKPIEVVEYASVLGTVGDIVLADLSQYALGEKPSQPLKRSIHVKFLEGEEVFRQTVRVDGLPLWNNKLLLLDGATYVSPFITCETRA